MTKTETAKEIKQLGTKRTLQGIVVSDKMAKTIVVKVERKVKHGQYMKYVLKSTKYKAHDEGQTAKIGDRVEILETRPMSAQKRWALKTILERASIRAGEGVEV